MNTPYAPYDVLDKWDSVSFDDTTRRVLDERLNKVPQRRFFSEDEWHLLDAISARLIPQTDRTQPVPITPWIDADLYENRGEGFRYHDAPVMQVAWRHGLAAIEAEALRRHGQGFAALDAPRQDDILHALRDNDVDSALWSGMSAQHFFIHVLLKTVAGIYYSHPAAWSEIGFGGPASPRGYVRLGFDQQDSWEAREARTAW